MLLAWVGVCLSAHAGEGDWPWWRGPSRNGVAAAGQDPPLKWSETENILWKTPIPGRGHGSPIVVGDRVYLATADEQRETRSLMCLDRESGAVVWSTSVHEGKPTPPRNAKGTQASSTPACDGERLFINFLHDGGMYTSAVSLDGEILWQKRIDDYVVHQGYGSSPAVYGPLVIVSADNKSGGAVAALDRESGEIVWRHDRPETPNYPSPIILDVAGRTQLIMTGCDLVSSFDPLTGEKLWEIEGATTECVTSTVTDGKLVYSSGGYPRNHVAAIRADGSGKIAWENGTRVYVPSMLMKDGTLYATADAGFAVCWNAATGDEQWKGRLGGNFTSSPVLVGKRIYATNEEGRTYVFRASPEKFELLAENTLGNQCFATPAICGGRIYTRVADEKGGVRQEYLYCVGEEESGTGN
jgi:outer membrane protein assembly factor BamB